MIGIFDSGLGGLSVLSAIARSLPHADLLYFADTAHVPYGAKPEAFIRERVLTIGRYLANQGCDMIVVACNTATAAAVLAAGAMLGERTATSELAGSAGTGAAAAVSVLLGG